MNKFMMAAILCALCSFAQIGYAENAELRIEADSFKEQYVEKVNVSGSIKAGAIALPTDQVAEIESLWIDIPETDLKMVCVSIVSVDGRYEAEFSHNIEDGQSGKTKVIIPTRYEDVMKSYAPADLAVRAQIKENCKKVGRDIFASWQPDFGEDMMFFVNSEAMNDVLRLKTKGGETKSFRCIENDSDRPVAYNKGCLIKGYKDYDLSKVMIIRKNFSSYLDPVSYTFEY